jgi:hypothetical protein
MAKSLLMKVVVPLIVGCLLTCCLNTVIYKLQMGSNTVILPESAAVYLGQVKPINQTKDLEPIGFKHVFKWTLAPACFTFIIWGIILWFSTREEVSVKQNIDEIYV